MRKLKLDLSAVSVDSFATLGAAGSTAGTVNGFAPTIPPWCYSVAYTNCPCTPRADER